MTVIPYSQATTGPRVLRLRVPTVGVPESMRAWFTSKRLLHLSVGILLSGIAVSIFTTTDQTWWQSMFSALGTFDDFSGYVFNATVFLAGSGIAIVGFRVAGELRRIRERGARKRSGALTILVVSAGIHLAGVGLMPININQFLHERAASGVMLSFLCILATTASARRHIPAQLRRATWIVGGVLVAAIAVFVTGFINLALFEVAGFGLIFVWLHVMTRCLERALDTPRQRAIRHDRCQHGTPRRPEIRRLATQRDARRGPRRARPEAARPSVRRETGLGSAADRPAVRPPVSDVPESGNDRGSSDALRTDHRAPAARSPRGGRSCSAAERTPRAGCACGMRAVRGPAAARGPRATAGAGGSSRSHTPSRARTAGTRAPAAR